MIHSHGSNFLNSISMPLLEFAWAKESENEPRFLQSAAVSTVHCTTAQSPANLRAQAPAQHLASLARPQMPKQRPSSKLGGSSSNFVCCQQIFAELCALQKTTEVILLVTALARLPGGSAGQQRSFTLTQIHHHRSPSMLLCSALFSANTYGKAAACRLSV